MQVRINTHLPLPMSVARLLPGKRQEALQAAESQRPDIILMDVYMPEMDNPPTPPYFDLLAEIGNLLQLQWIA